MDTTTKNKRAPSYYLLYCIKESQAERKNYHFHLFKNNRAAIDFLNNK